MLRRRYGVSLEREEPADEDVNPNEYMVNIADCMLALLLGMIVALISYYNVDLTQSPTSSDEIVGIKVNMDENQDGVIDDGYERRGEVYYDESSGEYYFIDEKGA